MSGKTTNKGAENTAPSSLTQEELTKKISELEGVVAEKEEKISELEGVVAEIKQGIQGLNEELNAKNGIIDALEAKAKELDEMLDECEAEISRLKDTPKVSAVSVTSSVERGTTEQKPSTVNFEVKYPDDYNGKRFMPEGVRELAYETAVQFEEKGIGKIVTE